MILYALPTLKCSEQTLVPAAIVNSLPLSQGIPGIHYFPLDANVGQFLSLLVAFKNTKTSRHSEIKQTKPSTKQDFSGEALSKQNTEVSLASLSCNLSRVPTEWSAYLHLLYIPLVYLNNILHRQMAGGAMGSWLCH